MAKDSDPLAGAFETKESGGLLSGLLAEENEFDRRMMWRLGSWGAAAVGAVIVAVMANQAHLGWRRDQLAAADMARQSERLQMLTKESQNEARRLAAAIETLNTDRDRLYSRVTVLEQGLDSVTGAIAKQNAAPAAPPASAKPQTSNPEPAATAPPAAPQAAAPSAPPSIPPSVAPVASTPSPPTDKPRADAAKEKDKDQPSPPQQTAAAAPPAAAATAPATPAALPAIPLVASKSIMAPPDPAASKLIQPETPAKPATEAAPPAAEAAAAPAAKEQPEEAAAEAPSITVQQTRFAVDLGGASSVGGLRALWRGLTKSNPELAALRPIIMIKESNTGLGMQLRLGAGPLINAAAAAKICAALSESDRSCETTVFDGQRLSMKGQEAAPQAQTPPAAAKPDKQQHRRSYSRRSKREEPAPQPAPAKPETTSTLSSFFSRR